MSKFIETYSKVLTWEARFVIMAICLGQFVYDKDVSWSVLGIILVSATGMFRKTVSKRQGKFMNAICVATLLVMYWAFMKCYFGL